MKRPLLFIPALMFSGLLALATGVRAENGTVDPLIEKGETLFNKNCSECHGKRARGTEKGPPLVHKIYHPNHHADVTFHWAVERGVRAHHWFFGNMPKIEGLSYEDVEAIIKYVRGLQKEVGIY